MSFTEFKNLQKRAKWSVSFGEGYDGYSAFAYYKSGIGFGVYNKNFFPDNFKTLPRTFYKSYDELRSNIISDISFLNNKGNYEKYVKQVLPLIIENNSPQEVINNLKKFYDTEYKYLTNL